MGVGGGWLSSALKPPKHPPDPPFVRGGEGIVRRSNTVVGFVRGGRIGFVWGKPLARSIALFRNSTHQNGSVGSFGKSIRWRSRLPSRPIPPIMPLASFGNRVVGLVRGGELASFGEPGPRTRLASFGETVRAVRRTSLIGTNCQRAVHARTPASSSGDATSAFGESVEEGWHRRGRHRRQVFDRASRSVNPISLKWRPQPPDSKEG